MEVFELFGAYAVFMMIYNFFAMALCVVSYVMRSLGLYTIAKRRGIHKPWTAWVPIADYWLIGSISDHYHWATKGEYRKKRVVILTLALIMMALFVLAFVLFAASFAQIIIAETNGVEPNVPAVLIPMLTFMGMYFPLLGLAVAVAVFQYICLYDLYAAASPSNKVLFLVLSIVFSITVPFFIYFLRNKDDGLLPPQYPPYYQPPYPPQYPYGEQQVPPQEPWQPESGQPPYPQQ